MSPRKAAYRAAIEVAVEDALTHLVRDLEGIKDVHAMTDEEMTAALRGYPTLPEFWLEWRLRQAPLTQQIPIVNQSVGDINDL
jgi:hypothetical protein